VRAELGQEHGDVVPQHERVGARGEERGAVVARREDGLDDGGEQPEGVFGGGHDEQEGGGDEVHALAVAELRVAARVGEEDFAELGHARAGAEEDIVGHGAVDVHGDLREGLGVVDAVLDEVVIVARDAQGGGAAAFGPDLGAVGDGDAGEDELREFFPFGAPDFAFVAEVRDADHFAVCEANFGHVGGLFGVWRCGIACLLARGADFAQEFIPFDGAVVLERVMDFGQLRQEELHRFGL